MHEFLEFVRSLLPSSIFQTSVVAVGVLAAAASIASNFFFWASRKRRERLDEYFIEGLTVRLLGDHRIELLISGAPELEDVLAHVDDRRSGLKRREVEVLLNVLERRTVGRKQLAV